MIRLACLLILAPLSVSAADEAAAKELKSLQGKWKAVAFEMGGKPLPKDSMPEFHFVVEADGKCKGQMGKEEYLSMLSVDPAKSPKTIDNAHTSGQYKDKKQYGIYKLDDGKWIVCMSAPGAAETDRPKSFDTKDTKYVTFTFEKVKDEKKP